MRWQWLLIGVLVTGALSLRAGQSDPQATLEARTARLQAHIEHVESVRAVKRLQYAYGRRMARRRSDGPAALRRREHREANPGRDGQCPGGRNHDVVRP